MHHKRARVSKLSLPMRSAIMIFAVYITMLTCLCFHREPTHCRWLFWKRWLLVAQCFSTRVGGIPFQIDESCGRWWKRRIRWPAGCFRGSGAATANVEEHGRAALARVRANFDWDRSADQTYALYCEIKNGGKSRFPSSGNSREAIRA